MNLKQRLIQTWKTFGAANTHGKHLTPQAKLTLNGQVFGTQTMSRLISLNLIDKRGFEADELTIELNDYDGALAIPEAGSKITLELGYAETGLIDKGEYTLTECTCQGSPDTLSLTARAADIADTLMEQKEKSWHKTTLYAIAQTIALENKYQPAIAAQYKNIKIEHIDQTQESDASFLTRLAEQHDAIATIKQGKLIFAPMGESLTTSGIKIPTLRITRQLGDQHRFGYNAANAYTAVRAYYTDKKTGKRMEVVIDKTNLKPEKRTTSKTHVYKRPRKDKKTGKVVRSKTTHKTTMEHRKINTDGLKIKTLRHLYASEATAWHGAAAAFKKLARGVAEFSLTLATGRPDLFPEIPVDVVGFKPEIDNQQWLIVELSHQLSQSGLSSSVKFEARIEAEDEQAGGKAAAKK
nr:MAG TPA: tail protein [Caudoviricetes sp.]